jgi:hypothetical protein
MPKANMALQPSKGILIKRTLEMRTGDRRTSVYFSIFFLDYCPQIRLSEEQIENDHFKSTPTLDNLLSKKKKCNQNLIILYSQANTFLIFILVSRPEKKKRENIESTPMYRTPNTAQPNKPETKEPCRP